MRSDLTIDTLRPINEGGMNVVVVVNDAWVFRFVPTDDGWQALAHELRAFDLLRGRVDLALPDTIVRCDDAIVWLTCQWTACGEAGLHSHRQRYDASTV
jgi:hypothetical protein